MDDMTDNKSRAAAWFRTLRDDIVAAFEALEDRQTGGPLAHLAAGRFELRQ
ncbi:MAG: coproporphyrinogen III oxidase, partial [Paracoccaceae bacterium]